MEGFVNDGEGASSSHGRRRSLSHVAQYNTLAASPVARLTKASGSAKAMVQYSSFRFSILDVQYSVSERGSRKMSEEEQTPHRFLSLLRACERGPSPVLFFFCCAKKRASVSEIIGEGKRERGERESESGDLRHRDHGRKTWRSERR